MGKHIKDGVKIVGERLYTETKTTDSCTGEKRVSRIFAGVFTHKSNAYGWLRDDHGDVGQFPLANLKGDIITGEINWNEKRASIEKPKKLSLFDLKTVDAGKKTKMSAWD